MTYSMDLRERVVAAVESGQSIAAVSRRFEVSRPTVRDWRARAAAGVLEPGVLEPGVPGPRGPVKLQPEDDTVMMEAVAEKPGITARELIPKLSVAVAECTVCRRLRKLGLTLKKNR